MEDILLYVFMLRHSGQLLGRRCGAICGQVKPKSVSRPIDFSNCLDKQKYICNSYDLCRNYKNFLALFRGLGHTPGRMNLDRC